MAENKKSVRQQFHLTEGTEGELDVLSVVLNKKTNELKKEILTAFAKVPSKYYYIALGEIQSIGEGVYLQKRR